MGPSRCCLFEVNNETIKHLLSKCPIAEAIWEKSEGIFKKNHREKGRLDLTIAEWSKQAFKTNLELSLGVVPSVHGMENLEKTE